MLKRLSQYINDDEFRMTIYENKIHIINFKRILSLEDNYISFQNNHQKISIIGNKLVLNKLLEKEVLIKGIILKIEVSNE